MSLSLLSKNTYEKILSLQPTDFQLRGQGSYWLTIYGELINTIRGECSIGDIHRLGMSNELSENTKMVLEKVHWNSSH